MNFEFQKLLIPEQHSSYTRSVWYRLRANSAKKRQRELSQYVGRSENMKIANLDDLHHIFQNT